MSTYYQFMLLGNSFHSKQVFLTSAIH